MKLDRSELLLKATAINFVYRAVAHFDGSLRHAVAFEGSTTKEDQEIHAQHAANHQFEALLADEAARMCGAESDSINRFTRMFFATDIEDITT